MSEKRKKVEGRHLGIAVAVALALFAAVVAVQMGAGDAAAPVAESCDALRARIVALGEEVAAGEASYRQAKESRATRITLTPAGAIESVRVTPVDELVAWTGKVADLADLRARFSESCR